MFKAGNETSLWQFSGPYWAGWTATWVGVIALVTAVPESHDHKNVIGKKSVAAASVTSVPAAVSAAITVTTTGFDFAHLPATAFGDQDSSQNRRTGEISAHQYVAISAHQYGAISAQQNRAISAP